MQPEFHCIHGARGSREIAQKYAYTSMRASESAVNRSNCAIYADLCTYHSVTLGADFHPRLGYPGQIDSVRFQVCVSLYGCTYGTCQAPFLRIMTACVYCNVFCSRSGRTGGCSLRSDVYTRYKSSASPSHLWYVLRAGKSLELSTWALSGLAHELYRGSSHGNLIEHMDG